MTLAELLAYLGPAAVLGVLSGAGVAAVLRAMGRAVDCRHALTLGLSASFLFLTQYPLPDPATLDCSGGGVRPILQPLATVDHILRLWHYSRFTSDPLALWLGSQILQAAAMNFALCAAIGAAYASHDAGKRSALRAFTLAVVLSLGAELTQLSGLFGFYPCAWRTFETDDLIFNIGGMMSGFALVRRLQRSADDRMS